MDELKVIKVMNEAKIEILKEKNNNYEEHIKIKQILEDEACFFKIEKNKAYYILRRVGVKENKIDEVYKKLIMPNVYHGLVKKGIINENDECLVIKYNNYRKWKFV